MGRAIAVMTVVVMVILAGVLLDLWRRRPAGAPPPPRKPGPVLVNELDGSIYDLTLKLDQVEQRLVKSEQRSKQQAGSLTALRKENEDLREQVRSVEGELERVRREIPRPVERPAPAANPPTPAPGPTPTPTPPTPEPGQTGGTEHR